MSPDFFHTFYTFTHLHFHTFPPKPCYIRFIITIIIITGAFGAVWCACVAALAVGIGRLKHPSGSARPKASVLIAARNEEANIGRCLEALVAQDYPRELWEVIVIDDDSSDRTAEIARSFAGRLPNLKVISAGIPTAGLSPKKRALAVGIAQSSGEIILTTDADCVPPPGWVRGMAGCFERGVDVVAGHSPLGLSVSQSLSHFDSFINATVSAGTIGLGFPSTAVGRNFAYRKSAWERVGGFTGGASGDDDLLLQRIAASGGKVAFASDPATFVPAQGPATFADWWRMKRRHLSAGKRYRPGFVTLSAALYLFNVGLAALAVTTILGLTDWQYLAAIWGVKAAFDGVALAMGARLGLAAGKSAIAWLVAEIISPFLFTVLVPAAVLGRVRWKGRELNN